MPADILARLVLALNCVATVPKNASDLRQCDKVVCLPLIQCDPSHGIAAWHEMRDVCHGRWVPVGSPIRNTVIWVAPRSEPDSADGRAVSGSDAVSGPASPQVLPRGAEGEVWAAGAGVAAGYLPEARALGRSCGEAGLPLGPQLRRLGALHPATLTEIVSSGGDQRSVLLGAGALQWLRDQGPQGASPPLQRGVPISP